MSIDIPARPRRTSSPSDCGPCGWQARDPFGDATRAADGPGPRAGEARRRSAPTASTSTTTTWSRSAATTRTRDRIIDALQARASPTPGWSSRPPPPTCSRTRSSRTAASPPTTATCAASRSARSCATSTSPPSSAPRSTSAWGGREGAEYGAAKDVAGRARPHTRRPSTCSASSSPTAATTSGSRSSPSPTSHAATSCCRPSATRWPSSRRLDRPELVGVNPEIGHEEMAGLNAAAGYAQALWQGKLFHIDLNGQNGPKYDQDLRFGAGNVRGAFWVVDTLLAGGYDGPVHFDFKPARTEDDDGCLGRRPKACMRNYLILREKVRAFRADPEVQAALEAAKLPELARPTLAEGETWRACSTGRCPDVEAIAARGAGLRAARPARARAPLRGPLSVQRRPSAPRVRRRNAAAVLRSLRQRRPAQPGRARRPHRPGQGDRRRDRRRPGAGRRGRASEQVRGAGPRPPGPPADARRWPTRRPRASRPTSSTSPRSSLDLPGGVRHRVSRRSPTCAGVERALAALAEEVAALLRDERLRPVGATVAVPGLIAEDDRTIAWTPNLGLTGTSLAARSTTAFGWQDCVRVEQRRQLRGARRAPPRRRRAAPTTCSTSPAPSGIGAGHRRRTVGWCAARAGFAGEVGHLPIGDCRRALRLRPRWAAGRRRSGCTRCWRAVGTGRAGHARGDGPGGRRRGARATPACSAALEEIGARPRPRARHPDRRARPRGDRARRLLRAARRRRADPAPGACSTRRSRRRVQVAARAAAGAARAPRRPRWARPSDALDEVYDGTVELRSDRLSRRAAACASVTAVARLATGSSKTGSSAISAAPEQHRVGAEAGQREAHRVQGRRAAPARRARPAPRRARSRKSGRK